MLIFLVFSYLVNLIKLFFVKVKRHDGLFKIPLTWYEVCKNIAETNAAEIIIGIICIIILYILKVSLKLYGTFLWHICVVALSERSNYSFHKYSSLSLSYLKIGNNQRKI